MKHPYTITHEHPESNRGYPVILKGKEILETSEGVSEIREHLGLTMEKLADLLGCSVHTVKNWRRTVDPQKPTAQHLNQLSNILKTYKPQIKIRCILEDGTDFSKVIQTSFYEAEEEHLGKSFSVVGGKESKCVEIQRT